MKKIAFLMLLVVTAAIVMMGCASMDAAAIDLATRPSAAAGAAVGSKTGEASSTNILSLVAFGERGVADAAKNGGITKIATVDIKNFGILGIYGKYTTIVTGE